MKFVQVAGHKNLMAKGRLVYKKFDSTEYEFYKAAAELRLSWIPKFYGKCDGRCFENKLEGKMAEEDMACHIILENLIDNVGEPILADIKLGSILYDHNASEEKKARMIMKSNSSTSSSLSLRICGMYTPDGQIDSKFGYSLTYDNFISKGLDILLHTVQTSTIGNLITKVERIKEEYQSLKKLECYSSSLFIIIEGEKIELKIIDFCHSFVRDHHEDLNVLNGLESLINLLRKYLKTHRKDQS